MQNTRMKYKCFILMLLLSASIIMSPLAHAQGRIVKEIAGHSIEFNERTNEIIHTISSREYNLTDIELTDYVPVKADGDPVQYMGKSCYRVISRIDSVDAGQKKTTTYSIHPKDTGPLTIYSVLKYELGGELHEKVPAEKAIHILTPDSTQAPGTDKTDTGNNSTVNIHKNQAQDTGKAGGSLTSRWPALVIIVALVVAGARLYGWIKRSRNIES